MNLCEFMQTVMARITSGGGRISQKGCQPLRGADILVNQFFSKLHENEEILERG